MDAENPAAAALTKPAPPALVKAAAILAPVVGVGLLAGVGWVARDSLVVGFNAFLDYVVALGPWGWPAYTAAYALLEVFLIPAIPLSMTAGYVFGVLPGTAAVALGGTTAATIAFLISRYFLQERVQGAAAKFPKFSAIDKAVSRDGLRVVALLRLSPLLPQANVNYLFGLTSLRLRDYVLGTLLGSLPNSFLYVNAGRLGRKVISDGAAATAAGGNLWQIGAAIVTTAIATTYVVRLANRALEDELASDSDSDSDDEEEDDRGAVRQ